MAGIRVTRFERHWESGEYGHTVEFYCVCGHDKLRVSQGRGDRCTFCGRSWDFEMAAVCEPEEEPRG